MNLLGVVLMGTSLIAGPGLIALALVRRPRLASLIAASGAVAGSAVALAAALIALRARDWLAR